MKVGPKSSLRPFLHRALQFSGVKLRSTQRHTKNFTIKGICIQSTSGVLG